MCSCHSILECCVTFSGVKLSIRSFVLFPVLISMVVITISKYGSQGAYLFQPLSAEEQQLIIFIIIAHFPRLLTSCTVQGFNCRGLGDRKDCKHDS